MVGWIFRPAENVMLLTVFTCIIHNHDNYVCTFSKVLEFTKWVHKDGYTSKMPPLATFACQVKRVRRDNLPVRFHHWTALCDDADGKTWIIRNHDNRVCNFRKVLEFTKRVHKISNTSKMPPLATFACVKWNGFGVKIYLSGFIIEQHYATTLMVKHE